ncbi:MAG: VTT domain-containing protein [Candidatus Aenigmarchaeota archaeon]|nr:VTT domain-containing protein [Candidatus Aenigmarchaeota archaeon]
MEGLALALLEQFGYLGLFLVSAISSATIFLPLPGYLVIPIAATTLNPFLVGVVAGAGSAVGEMTSYGIGLGGRKLSGKAKKDLNAWFERLKNWFARYNGVAIIFAFSALPLPFDVMGLFCGAIKYDARKFFIATLSGKVMRYLILAYATVLGIDAVAGLLH